MYPLAHDANFLEGSEASHRNGSIRCRVHFRTVRHSLGPVSLAVGFSQGRVQRLHDSLDRIVCLIPSRKDIIIDPGMAGS